MGRCCNKFFLIDSWGEEVIELKLKNCKKPKQASKIYQIKLVKSSHVAVILRFILSGLK